MRAGVGLDLPADFQPIHVRQLDIEDHEPRHPQVHLLEGFAAGGRFDHREAASLEHARDEVAARVVVVHVEHERASVAPV